MEQLSECFLLPNAGAQRYPPGFAGADLWGQIAQPYLAPDYPRYQPMIYDGQRLYNPRTAKSSAIFNAAFRYVLKCLACGMLGRGDSGGFGLVDNFFLENMIEERVFAPALYFAEHLESHGRQGTGAIVGGGLLTVLAEYVGIDYVDLPIERGISLIDLSYCASFFLIKQVRNSIYLLYHKGTVMLLPNIDETNPFDRRKWHYDPENPIPPPASNHEASSSRAPPTRSFNGGASSHGPPNPIGVDYTFYNPNPQPSNPTPQHQDQYQPRESPRRNQRRRRDERSHTPVFEEEETRDEQVDPTLLQQIHAQNREISTRLDGYDIRFGNLETNYDRMRQSMIDHTAKIYDRFGNIDTSISGIEKNTEQFLKNQAQHNSQMAQIIRMMNRSFPQTQDKPFVIDSDEDEDMQGPGNQGGGNNV